MAASYCHDSLFKPLSFTILFHTTFFVFLAASAMTLFISSEPQRHMSYNIPMRYFLYARKSTDVEDKQVLSIEAQLAELRALAKSEQLEIDGEFVEKRSAKMPGRPVFMDMMARIQKGEAQGIVCWKIDRLARNPVDGGQIHWLLPNNP